jgi:Family of unknown function (DUF6335)
MAKRKSVAKKASRKSTPARRPAAKASKGRGAAKAAKKAAKRSVAKKAAKKVAKKAAKKAVARKVVAKKVVSKKATKAPAPAPAPVKAVAPKAAAPKASKAAKPKKAPTGTERSSIPSTLGLDERTASAAKSGGRAQRTQLKSHTETSPALTGGDVDANWEEAYASGDEAPGGDNPTPDQDRVDEIGHALGVEYNDNEELKGADKITERDKHRWELNPASSDDYRERK